MPVQATFYQRLFHRDLFVSPVTQQLRATMMRRHFSDRVCLIMSLLLLFYIGWYILDSPNRALRYKHDRAEELAYNRALNSSSPMIQNTQICSLDEVDLLFIVISQSSHFLERQAIRETWGSMPDLFGVHSQRLFVIGFQPGGNFYRDILNEATHEQDILYLTASDYSSTLKEIHGYRWLEQHCSRVVYLFKTEDDLFVNSFLLHELVRELKTNPEEFQNRNLYKISLSPLLLGQTSPYINKFLFGWSYQPGRPERNITLSPYYVTYAEYPNELYPRYCSGFGYFMNSLTRNALTAEAFKDKRPFRFSDIYLTGIIPERLNFVCDLLPFTFYQGTTEDCIKLIKTTNQKDPSPSTTTPPLITCSTGRHVGQNSFSDYYKIWTTLKHVYADRLQQTQ